MPLRAGPNRRNLPIVSGVIAAGCLVTPVTMWLVEDAARCTTLGRTVTVLIVTLGLSIAIAALPIGIWFMVAGRRARWLAAPVAAVAIAVEIVAFSQLGSDPDCVYQYRSIALVLGIMLMLAGFGLAGLAVALLRRDHA